MAKRRHRRHHRGYGDIISVPSFSGITSAIKEAGTGAFAGIAMGVIGGAGLTMALNNLPSIKNYIPTFLQPYIPMIGVALGGVGAYGLYHKKNPRRAKDLLSASLVVSGVLTASKVLNKFVPSIPSLMGYTTAPEFGVVMPSPMGVLLPSAMNGLQMAGAAMAESDELQGGF